MLRLLILLILLMLTMPTVYASDYDYKDGLLDSDIATTDLPTATYDNDTSAQSGYWLEKGKTYSIDFSVPVDLQAMYIYGGSSYAAGIKIVFIDGQTQQIWVGGDDTYGRYLDIDYKQVIRIEIERQSPIANYLLREIDFFGVPSEIEKEVKNVQVTAKYDSVYLTWQNPRLKDFEKVRIYRMELEQSLHFIPVAYAYNPIFETNGTYFRDLTVEPERSYEYKITTIIGGKESQGVTVQVTTPPIPPPSTGGTTIIRHENGDVTVRWTPQPGQMIIEIDGSEYKRVDAQLGEYTIPASDIPVDEHGRPAEIRLIPVAPNGDVGTPIVINPGGWLIALPFGAKELLEAGIDLLLVFGPIIFLVLVLWYVRPILRLLRQSARGRART